MVDLPVCGQNGEELVFVVVVVAGVDAVVEQVGRAVGFTGVHQGAGEGVLDDLAFDPDSAEAFGVLT